MRQFIDTNGAVQTLPTRFIEKHHDASYMENTAEWHHIDSPANLKGYVAFFWIQKPSDMHGRLLAALVWEIQSRGKDLQTNQLAKFENVL